MRLANSVWKSASVVVGLVSLAFALGVFLWRPWTSIAQPAKDSKPVAVKSSPVAKPLADRPVLAAPEVKVWITGSGGVKGKYYYFLSDGQMLTAKEIAAKFGVTVREVKEGAYYRLVGEGVEYGSGGN